MREAFTFPFLSLILLVGEQVTVRAWWLDGTEILPKLLPDLSEQLSLSELHQGPWLVMCVQQFLQGLSTCPGLHREDFLKTESQLILLAWITKTTFESLILIHIYCKRAVRYTSPRGSKAQGQGYRDNSISLYLADSSQQQSRQRHHQPVFNF